MPLCSQRRGCGTPLLSALFTTPSTAQVAIRTDFDAYLATDTFSVQVTTRVRVRNRVRVRVRVKVRVKVSLRHDRVGGGRLSGGGNIR